jgi:DDE superfamily endonuclease
MKPDRKRPVVCFDESPTQLIGEVRQPIPAAPGQPRRYDYEYRRNGTMNLFVFLDAHRPWGTVKVTERRTAVDFAQWWRSPYWDPSWMRLRARSVRYSWEIAREDPHPQPLVRRSSGSYGSMEEAYANGSVALTRVRSSSASD